jgi:hypothetical protein
LAVIFEEGPLGPDALTPGRSAPRVTLNRFARAEEDVWPGAARDALRAPARAAGVE